MFARSPAPVQATWLGYLGTTGVVAIDYLIADAWTLPHSDAVHFSESICYLPESYLCFTPPDGDMPVSPLPALVNDFVTFGSFNNLAKMNDAVVALWASVLGSVPNSRLLLKAKQLGEASVRQGVADRFARHGVDAGRLILKHQVPRVRSGTPPTGIVWRYCVLASGKRCWLRRFSTPRALAGILNLHCVASGQRGARAGKAGMPRPAPEGAVAGIPPHRGRQR